MLQIFDSLASVVRRLSRPVVELKLFDGQPLKYQRFIRQFHSKVEANCDTYEEKLDYLEQYTREDAQDIVVGFSYLKDPERAYTMALQELERKYGDQDVVVDAFIKKAINWTPIKADNPKELERFSIFLRECSNAVYCMDV